MAKSPRKGVRRAERKNGRSGSGASRRGGEARSAPQERALVDVTRVLERLDRPSAVIGGIAVIAWGFPRFTADIDVAIAAEPHEAGEVLKRFESGGFEPRTEGALEFAEQNLVLLLRADWARLMRSR